MKYISFLLSLLLLCGLLLTLPGTAYADSVLELPASVKLIEDGAFYGDRALGTVVLPDGITEIRSRAFADSSVREMNLPASLNFIADDAFDASSNVAFTASADSYGYSWAKTHGFPVTDPDAVTYRALLIGNNAYKSNPLQGCINDMNAMSSLLLSFSNGFSCTVRPDQTKSDMLSAIGSVFADAAGRDVSLFYYAGHGRGYTGTDSHGALVGIDDTYLTSSELAAALSRVPGRVIVILDSCYSGSAIDRDDGDGLADQETYDRDSGDGLRELEAFNQSMIDAFTACEPTFVLSDDEVFDAGELAQSKFVVITACGKSQIAGELNGHGLFTAALVTGGGCNYGSSAYTGSMPADTNGDSRLSVEEIASYTANAVAGRNASQTVQSYAADMSETLFRR